MVLKKMLLDKTFWIVLKTVYFGVLFYLLFISFLTALSFLLINNIEGSVAAFYEFMFNKYGQINEFVLFLYIIGNFLMVWIPSIYFPGLLCSWMGAGKTLNEFFELVNLKLSDIYLRKVLRYA